MPTPDELLREKLGAIHGGRILDVATGSGEFIELLATHLLGYREIVGIDVCARCLTAARSQLKCERVSLTEMDAAALLYPDAAFDTVAISNSLHHLADTSKVLQEMRRVLKPEGWFIIQEMYRDNQTAPQMSHVTFHHWRAEIDRLKGDTHDQTMTRPQILAALQDLNLAEVDAFDLFYGQEISRDDETLAWFDTQIDKSLGLVSGLPDFDRLKQEGEKIRQRIHSNGFAPADRLFVIGRKPA
jgi:2-polyprenyl-3-methyl-5-hydroxy-6-metoxy-1,4-benzoquinol methylase